MCLPYIKAQKCCALLFLSHLASIGFGHNSSARAFFRSSPAQAASCYSMRPVRYGRVKMKGAPGENSPSCPSGKAVNRLDVAGWLDVAGQRLEKGP